MREHPGSSTSARPKLLPYMPGLDGLRAIAVLAVLIYHAQPAWLPGGFLGVEVFFVVSGYIITALLTAEWDSKGGIDLGGFWARRARRLLPAAFAVIFASLIVSLLALPAEVAELRSIALAAATYCTNWYLILDQQSYFESWGRPSLLRHLWSLALEEQFYLIWPPLLALYVLKLRQRLGFCLLLLAAAASAAWMAYLYDSGADVSRLYYGTDTRATGFLIGGALGLVWRPTAIHGLSHRSRGRVEAAGGIGLVLLLMSLMLLDEGKSTLYQGGFATVSLCGAAVVMAVTLPAGRLSRLASTRPMVWVGVRSYGLYLWHWPVFMLTRPGVDVDLDGPLLLAVQLVACVCLAELSYRFIEQPTRGGGLGRLIQRLNMFSGLRRLAIGTSAVGSASALILVVIISAGMASSPALPSTAGSIRLVTSSSEQAEASALTSHGFLSPLVSMAQYRLFMGEADWQSSISSASSVALSPTEAPISEEQGGESEAQAANSEAPTVQVSEESGLIEESVSVIGDSVLLGSVYQMARVFPNLDLDAAMGRQASTFVGIIRGRFETGGLGRTVVLQAGNNGPVSRAQVDEMLWLLQDVEKVVVINVTVPRPWQDSNNRVIAAAVQEFGNARLVDWHSVSRDQPELFASDGVHLTREGVSTLVAMIAEAIQR